MWICKKCNEENEDSFDACWKCQTVSDIGMKKSKIYHQELEHKKKQDSEEKEKESLIYEQLDKKAVQIWAVTILAGFVSAYITMSIFIMTGLGGGAMQGLVTAATFYYSGSQTKKAYTKHLRKEIVEKLEK